MRACVQVQSMSYSVIIFDTAPTGHTLRLLQFPSTLEKGLAKLASLRGMFGGLLDQVASMIGASMGGNREGLLGKLEDLKVEIAALESPHSTWQINLSA